MNLLVQLMSCIHVHSHGKANVFISLSSILASFLKQAGVVCLNSRPTESLTAVLKTNALDWF